MHYYFNNNYVVLVYQANTIISESDLVTQFVAVHLFDLPAFSNRSKLRQFFEYKILYSSPYILWQSGQLLQKAPLNLYLH